MKSIINVYVISILVSCISMSSYSQGSIAATRKYVDSKIQTLKSEIIDASFDKDYNSLTNKPSINGVELLGNKTTSELGLISSSNLTDFVKKTDLEGFATEADLLAFYYPDGSVTNMNQITTNGLVYAVGYDGGAYVNDYIKGSIESLENIVLPWKVSISDKEYEVTAIGVGAFDCSRDGYSGELSFKTIIAPTTLKNIEGYAFYSYGHLTSASFPSVTNINIYSFYGNTSLTSISLPSLKNIESTAFAYCESLKSISIPFVTSIGDEAFWYCNSLTSVTIPLVKNIKYYTFYSCPLLTSISLPSVTNISDEAFGFCSSLSIIDFGTSPKSSIPTLGYESFELVPTSCKFIIPLGMYDEWIAAPEWSNLYSRGYKFDGYASIRDIQNISTNDTQNISTNEIINTAVRKSISEISTPVALGPYGEWYFDTQYSSRDIYCTDSSISNAVISFELDSDSIGGVGIWTINGLELNTSSEFYRIENTRLGDSYSTQLDFNIKNRNLTYDNNGVLIREEWVDIGYIRYKRKFTSVGSKYGVALMSNISANDNDFSNAVLSVMSTYDTNTLNIINEFFQNNLTNNITSNISNLVYSAGINTNENNEIITNPVTVGGSLAVLFTIISLLIKNLDSSKRYDLVTLGDERQLQDRAMTFIEDKILDGEDFLSFPEQVKNKARDFAITALRSEFVLKFPEHSTILKNSGFENNELFEFVDTDNILIVSSPSGENTFLVIVITEMKENTFYVRCMTTQTIENVNS